MPSSVRKTVAVGLALGWLILSGAVYPATVPHALHHAKHHATSHSSGLCSWLCAAGQTADVAALFDPALSVPVGSTQQTALVLPPLLPPQSFLSRGPPRSLNV
jgi:hypothetical protein